MSKTIQEYCKEKGYQLCNDNSTVNDKSDDNDSKEEVNYKIGSANKTVVDLILDCGHEKQVKLSSLASKNFKITCIICKNHKKYNYDYLTKSRYCPTCGITHTNVPSTNLGKWKCCFCCKSITYNKAEIELFKWLHDNKTTFKKHYIVSKNYKFPDSKTADLYIQYDGQTILIEVDDVSHLTKVGKETHITKDDYCIANKLKLIRFNKAAIESFKEHFESVVESAANEDKQMVTIFTETLDCHFFFGKIYKEHSYPPQDYRNYDVSEKKPLV